MYRVVCNCWFFKTFLNQVIALYARQIYMGVIGFLWQLYEIKLLQFNDFRIYRSSQRKKESFTIVGNVMRKWSFQESGPWVSFNQES